MTELSEHEIRQWPVVLVGGYYRYVNHDLKQASWGNAHNVRKVGALGTLSERRKLYAVNYPDGNPNKEPTMKPFNLEAAKAGKPIVTRDGRVAKFVAHEPDAVVPVVVLISGRMHLANADGAFPNAVFDLFMAEEEITVYFNEYTNGEFGCVERDRSQLKGSSSVVKVHEVKIKV